MGLIVNPVAGVGGPIALKGSDDRAQIERAVAEGAACKAGERARRCLTHLLDKLAGAGSLRISTCPGAMGESVVAGLVCNLNTLELPRREFSVAADTRAAAAWMREQGIDLLLFAGGDGTARDIYDAVGESVPVLGVPAGVKMHSGVFAVSPEAAGEVLFAMMSGQLVDLRNREVRDIDETGLREGRVRSRYYGQLRTPEFGHYVQSTKLGGREVEALVVDEIVADLRERLQDDLICLVGAGTTTATLMAELGLPATLLGVDVIQGDDLLSTDATAADLESLLDAHRGPAVAIVSITRGQGSLFGRGNQQFSPAVLRRLGRDNIWALATKTKITELGGRPLLMDSNDPQLDRDWSGYISVITGYHDRILYPLGSNLF